MIKVENLNKYYNKNKSNEIHVINDISLELPNLGLVSFLGASGSGKTTLLNIIGGLDRATGTISYDSFEVKKYDMSKIDKFRNEHIGYVFQSYNLLLSDTVYDNLKVALELIDIYDEKEVASRIEYALKSVGLYKYRKKKASQLSGGQQQRVAIARALVKQCKIIIADEPTGNLDSANAIEVMNILKSISKKTLVLLVTHNETLANFYSDFIYKLEDGKIIDKYENSSNDALSNTNDNNVYLKDMELIQSTTQFIDVKLYRNNNDNDNIQLEIIERNNTFYIKSNKTIKLIENSNLKIINDHYKPVEKNEISSSSYDDSFFNNSIKKRNIFNDFILNLKRSFLVFIKPTKKVKVIYTSLLLLGVLFAICAISIANAITVNTDSISADENYHTLSDGSSYSMYDDSEYVRSALINGAITDIQVSFSRYIDFSKQINFIESKTYSELYQQLYFNEKINKIIYGKIPVNDEIAISEKLAQHLLVQFKDYCKNYDDLFDLTINSSSTRIVGVVENPYSIVYVSKQYYLENIKSWNYIENDFVRYYQYEKKYDSYEIVYGRDLNDGDFNTSNILISNQIPNYEKYIGKQIDRGTVVGVFRLKNIEGDMNEIIINSKYQEQIKWSNAYTYEVENYLLVEGEHPTKETECLVSIYSDFKIGDTFQGYKIVGKYNGSTQLLRANSLLSISAVSIDSYTKKVFIIHDKKVLEDIISENFEIKNMYKNEYDSMKNTNNEKITIFSILGTICLISVSIMVYFLMRSRMVNDIYNIGVYRSLGSNKFKIYLKYFTDIFVMVTFTSLISYFVIIFGYLTAIESINDYYYTEFFSKNIIVPLLGIIVLYSVNILFGLLSIFTLLKKTPAEIMAKYDI